MRYGWMQFIDSRTKQYFNRYLFVAQMNMDGRMIERVRERNKRESACVRCPITNHRRLKKRSTQMNDNRSRRVSSTERNGK